MVDCGEFGLIEEGRFVLFSFEGGNDTVFA